MNPFQMHQFNVQVKVPKLKPMPKSGAFKLFRFLFTRWRHCRCFGFSPKTFLILLFHAFRGALVLFSLVLFSMVPDIGPHPGSVGPKARLDITNTTGTTLMWTLTSPKLYYSSIFEQFVNSGFLVSWPPRNINRSTISA